MPGGPLLFVLFGTIIVAAILYGALSASKRRKALTEWARANGLTFDESKDRSMDDRFGQFKCLRQGHNRYSYNHIRGQYNGRSFLGFDYHYETGSGKNRSTHVFSALVLGSDLPLEPLLIRPEHFFDKVTEFFGYDDIDFESAEFSRKFYVKSPNKKWAYDVIHQRTMDFLLSAPRFTIEFDRRHVIVYRSTPFKPEDYASAAGVVEGVLERLPEYVVRQQTG